MLTFFKQRSPLVKNLNNFENENENPPAKRLFLFVGNVELFVFEKKKTVFCVSNSNSTK
jgi:hypothetical protein